MTSEGLGPLLTADYPQLGEHVRFRRSTQNVLSYNEVMFEWENIFLADENVFSVFDHDIIAGDPATAFSDMNSIAVSESFARAYFGGADPIGEVLQSGVFAYRVTLVFADLPENTHLKYDALYPYRAMSQFVPNYEDNYRNSLGSVGVYTYLLVDEQFDPDDFASISEDFVNRYMTEVLGLMNASFEARLMRLDRIHFGSDTPFDEPLGNIFYIYGLAAVAIACINYMNLATARATRRAKEVGMRKVVGASRAQLIAQFLGESALFTLVSMLIGLGLALFALAFTPIGGLMGKTELLSALGEPGVWAGIVALALLVTLLAGLYPAFYLSSISPRAALSKIANTRRGGLTVRQGLVVAQIMISIGVIACTFLMSSQMRYVANKPLGFDKENKVWVELRGADLIERFETLETELLANPDIQDVILTGMVPGFGNAVNVIPIENNEGVIGPEQVDRVVVGMNLIEAMGINVLQGRAFSEDMGTDAELAFMANEALVRKMNWDEPLGKRIQLGNGEDADIATIVGVTEDFHYAPLNNEIGPLLIHPFVPDFSEMDEQTRPLQTMNLLVNISGNNVGDSLASIERAIRSLDPDHEFDPGFLDARLNELYESETNLMHLTEIFAAICIVISAMGLFGLSSFNTEQRKREIGIRKVLGASSTQIVLMLCRSIAFMVVLGAIPAILVSHYAMQSWLQRFAYQAEWDAVAVALPYVLAILLVSAVAVLTVMGQSLRTAQADPVQALRYE